MARVFFVALWLGVVACSTDPPITSESASSATTGVGASSSSAASTTGSGGAAAQGNGFESGNRLRARVYMGADGSKQFFGWWDVLRMEDCAYAKAADGKMRCLPSKTMPGSGYFQDAGCTKPLAMVAATNCAPTPTYVAYFDACADAAHIAPLTGKYSGTMVHYVDSGCISTPTPTGLTFYTLGAEVAASEFVEGTETVE